MVLEFPPNDTSWITSPPVFLTSTRTTLPPTSPAPTCAASTPIAGSGGFCSWPCHRERAFALGCKGLGT